MTRLRFDREIAWQAYQKYVAAPEPAPEDTSKKANKLRIQKENLYHATYDLVDEIVEIGVRQVFSKNKNLDVMDDLRQAARLRLFQFLPKISTNCLNSEHFFRMCLAGVRWASLNEFARLKRQSNNEIHNSPVDDDWFDEADDSGNNIHDIAVLDKEFDLTDVDIMYDQIFENALEATADRIAMRYTGKVRLAAHMVLEAAKNGTGISDNLIKNFGEDSPKDLQQTINIMWHEEVAEQKRLAERQKRLAERMLVEKNSSSS